jgi:hypothetical protein
MLGLVLIQLTDLRMHHWANALGMLSSHPFQSRLNLMYNTYSQPNNVVYNTRDLNKNWVSPM